MAYREAWGLYVAVILSAIQQQKKGGGDGGDGKGNLRIFLAGCRHAIGNITAMLRSAQQPQILSQSHWPKADVCGHP